MFTAAPGPAAARAPARRARGRAVAPAPALVPAPRDARCHARDHVLHPKIPRSPTRLKSPFIILC